MKYFWARLISFFRSNAANADLQREIDAHLQLLEDQFVAQGMSGADARFAARRAFGGRVEQTKLQHRDARSFRWMTESWLDLKLASRMLVKYPGLTIVGGVGMAVAIAISTASFAFFYAYMRSTLPLPDGHRIVALENWDAQSNNEEQQALHDYVLWRSELRSFEEIGAFRRMSRNLVIPGGSTEPVQIAEMTASAFRITRVPPLYGRPLLPHDEETGAAPVVVIGHDVWRSHFDSDPSAIGREVRLGNVVHTIVGVMPEGYLFPIRHNYWTALRTDTTRIDRGEGPAIFIFGRLAQNVTMADANAELATLGQRSAVMFPATHEHLRPQVLPYAYPILDIQDTSLWSVAMMQLMVSTVLIVVAVNVAILVYARTATRQGEIAVRTALGASRPRIIGQLFIEALVLSLVAAGVGLVIARIGLDQAHRLMATEMGNTPFWIDLGIPLAAVVYVAGLSIFAAVVAGVVPAIQATSGRVQSTLRELSGSSGMRLGRTWTLLVVSQVAFAVAALPVALNAGWNEVRGGATRPVFEANDYLAAAFAMDPEPPENISLDEYRRSMGTQFAKVQAELSARLEAEPWVGDVTWATAPPGQEGSGRVDVEGLTAPTAAGHAVSLNRVDVDFFEAVGAATLTGRSFSAADRDRDVIVVNRAFATTVLGSTNVLGRRVRYPAHIDEDDGPRAESPWYEIVGVVADLHSNVIDPEIVRPVVYHPLQRGILSTGSVIIRVAGGAPESYTARLRELAATVDPSVRLNAYPLVQIYRQANLAIRLMATALGLVLVSVLLLSAAGIYALMSFTVSQRKKEIGIRAALGADGTQLLCNVFARATGQLLLGLTIGVALTFGADALTGGELMGAQGRILVPSVAVLLLLTGFVATVGPARRGLRLQPIQALRDE
jgi:putative ABC transport system permease protein